MPAGFCDEAAFGAQTTEGALGFNGYVPGLACPKHGGPTIVEVYESLFVATQKEAARSDKGFKLEIETDSTEFANDKEHNGMAISRILRKVLAEVWAGCPGGTIKGVTGNVIGAWNYD